MCVFTRVCVGVILCACTRESACVEWGMNTREHGGGGGGVDIGGGYTWKIGRGCHPVSTARHPGLCL